MCSYNFVVCIKEKLFKKMSAKENLTANFNFIKHYNPLSFFFYANFIAKMTIYIKKKLNFKKTVKLFRFINLIFKIMHLYSACPKLKQNTKQTTENCNISHLHTKMLN